MNNQQPRKAILDAIGQVLPSRTTTQPDPVQGILFPLYLSIVPALAGSNHGAEPQAIADEAMEIALVALARIGFNFSDKTKENQS